MHILVVDDERSARDGLTRLLEMQGHTTCWAANGRTALSLMRSENPGVVILDILLEPGEQTGWDVLREKLLDERLRKIDVIVLSGLTTQEIREGAESVQNALAGVTLMMGKPVDARVLFSAIDHLAELAGPNR